MKLEVGMRIKTNYSDSEHIITAISDVCNCTEFIMSINGSNKPSEDHYHITAKDADGMSILPSYFNGYRMDGSNVWRNDDKIIVLNTSNVQLLMF